MFSSNSTLFAAKHQGWPLFNQTVTISPLDLQLSTVNHFPPSSAPPRYPPSRPYGLQLRTNPAYLPRSLRLQPLSYQSTAHSFHQQWGYAPSSATFRGSSAARLPILDLLSCRELPVSYSSTCANL